jgi:hypothetical protein
LLAGQQPTPIRCLAKLLQRPKLGERKKKRSKEVKRTWKEPEKQCYYSENPKNRRGKTA